MGQDRIRDDQVRQRLTVLRLATQVGMQQACWRLGKSLSYGYRWQRRYRAGGHDWRSVQNRSSRPQRLPRLSRPAVVRRVLAVRRATGWGKARLAARLRLPVSTVGHILRRARVTRAPRRWATQKKHRRCYNLLWPGQRVQLDVKFVPFKIGARQYYQYTVIDECTRLRYLMIKEALWTRYSVEAVQAAQRYFGFPIQCVQTDNGTEFTFRYTAERQARHGPPKPHPLDVYCQQHGITHRCIPPGAKELNGKVERSHRTDEEEFYQRYATPPSVLQLHRDHRRWMHYYNRYRAHSGIGGLTPWAFARQRLRLMAQLAPHGDR